MFEFQIQNTTHVWVDDGISRIVVNYCNFGKEYPLELHKITIICFKSL